MNDIIIALAKAAILVALNQPENFDLEDALKSYPMLQHEGAAFVTINTKSNHKLRGCIGTLQAYRPLYKDIIFNAQYAALNDSRFTPLKKEELNNITLEVSILTKPKKLLYKNQEDLEKKVIPLQDGIILRYKEKQATYLPQVWEQLPQFNTFFSNLCLKAGLDANCLLLHPKIFTYHVKKYKER